MKRTKIRTLFISDVHLGSKFCRSQELLLFLRRFDVEQLYLVGDFIDGWQMKRRVSWDDSNSFILRRIFGMIKDGANVVYVAGNHDDFLRNILPASFGHISFVNEIIHTTADGKKFLVIHGDVFDCTMKFHWLYTLGDRAHHFAMSLNRLYNKIRKLLGKPYWSLSAMLKRNVKEAINFIGKFEHFIAEYTKSKECDGVICGHIHSPAIKTIEGIQYLNCGDWVESCTALIEYPDGKIELVDYNSFL